MSTPTETEHRPTEIYTPGYSANASAFMSERTLHSHGAFILPFLKPEAAVLDLGCGPGTITLGLAEAVFPGQVTGLDRDEESIRHAERLAWGLEMMNVSFQVGDAYEIPFEDETFDVVFAHALFEHLSRPEQALREIHRVLKPGGVIGLCSPDWNRFNVTPWTPGTRRAIEAYRDLQENNGGNTSAGGWLEDWITEAGFKSLLNENRWERYESAERIGEYLALQLEAAGQGEEAEILRFWQEQPEARFDQAWTEVAGFKA